MVLRPALLTLMAFAVPVVLGCSQDGQPIQQAAPAPATIAPTAAVTPSESTAQVTRATLKDVLRLLPDHVTNLTLDDLSALLSDSELRMLAEERHLDYWGDRLEELAIFTEDISTITGVIAGQSGELVVLSGNLESEEIKDELYDLGFEEDDYRGTEVWSGEWPGDGGPSAGSVAVGFLSNGMVVIGWPSEGGTDEVKDVIRVLERGSGSLHENGFMQRLSESLPDGVSSRVELGCSPWDIRGCVAWGETMEIVDADTVRSNFVLALTVRTHWVLVFEDERGAGFGMDDVEEALERRGDVYGLTVSQDGDAVIAQGFVDTANAVARLSSGSVLATPATVVVAAASMPTPTTRPLTIVMQATSVPASIAPAVPFANARTSPGAGQRITVAISSLGNGRMDPFLSTSSDLTYQRIFNQSLVGGRGGGVLTSAIADGWEMSTDAKIWKFAINEGPIRFHNGDILTAGDVFFSMDSRYGDGARDLLNSGYYERRDVALGFDPQIGVSSISHTPGSNMVSISWKAPNLGFAFNWSENAGTSESMIIPETYTNLRMTPRDKGFEGYERQPVGAGPMIVSEFRSRQVYKFERFIDYFWHPGNGFVEDRRVRFEYLDMIFVPEDNTRVAMFQTGQADLIEANVLMRSRITTLAGGKIAWQPESNYTWIVMVDCWEPDMWCYDKRVRQALDYGFNKKLIASQLYGQGATVKGWAHVTPGSLGYSPDLDPYPYDPNKARDLLRQAGIVDGKFHGQQVKFNVWTWDAVDTPLLPELSQLMADNWVKELGFDVQVIVGAASKVRQDWNNRQLPGSVLIRSNLTRFDGTSITQGGYDNPDIAWRAVRHPDEEPWAGTTTPAVRRALNDLNPATRQDSFNEMYKTLRDDHTYWSAFYTNRPWGYNSRIRGYRPWNMVPGLTAIWTVELNQ